MRVEPKSKTTTLGGKPIAVKNYRRMAAIIFVFAGVFYFLYKVVF